MAEPVGRDDHALRLELVQRAHAAVLAQLGSRLGRAPGQAADPARRLDRPVARVQERRGEPAPQRRGELGRVEPLGREPVIDERLVLRAQRRSLRVVDREPKAAERAERVARERGEPRLRLLCQLPVRPRRVVTELLPGGVVRHRAAAQREAAVASARTAGDLARLVQPHADARLRERERTRAARDAAADDLDFGHAREGGPRQRLLPLFEPVRRHTAIVLTARSAGTRRRWSPRGPRARAPRARPPRPPASRPADPDELVRARRTIEPLEDRPRRFAEIDFRLGGRFEAEQLEHVAGRGQRRGSEPQERIRSRAQRGRDLTRARKDLASLLEREVRGDQRAASLARLDDDGGLREPGDDSVPGGEPPGCGLDPGCVLGDDQAGGGDPGSQLRVRRGIVAVDTAAEHGDRRAAALERAAVRLAVDAARETADHDEPGRRKLAAEHPRDLRAVPRAGARADDRDRGLRQQLRRRSATEEQP